MVDLTQTERRLVWILGSPRSGSTWLMNLLAAGSNVRAINEPGIGVHLGAMLDTLIPVEPYAAPPVYTLQEFRRETEDYFFSTESEPVWRPALRSLILERLGVQLGSCSYAIVKEPHGSQAAEMLMSLVPRSRMIFLLRDGRDVVDSVLDATTPGSWLMSLMPGFRAMDRETSVRSQAYLWLWRTDSVQRAFEAHRNELKRIVRYEELHSDPGAVLLELASWLGLESEPMVELARHTAVDSLAKDRGKFIRAATPGLWRENLSAREQALVDDILGEKLGALGYET